MTFVYVPEARARIIAFEMKGIQAYLESVPEKYRVDAFMGLKPIQGFRRDEPREIKKRIALLATNIAASRSNGHKATDREWDVLGHVWAALCFSKYEDSVRDAIATYRKEQCTLESFLKKIVEKSNGLGLSREELIELFQFSPFPSLEDAGPVLSEFLPKKDLEQKKTLAKLPEELKALRAQVEAMSSSVAERNKQSPEVSSAEFVKVYAEIDVLRKSHADIDKKYHLLEEVGASRHKALTHTIETGTHSSEATARKLSSYETRVIALERSNIEALSSLRKVEGVLKPLQKAVAEHEKVKDHLKVDSENSQVGLTSLVGVPTQRSLSQGNIGKLDSVQLLYKALHSNFLSVGVVESSARQLAGTIAAATYSGQLVLIGGSLAEVVAEAAICTTNGGELLSWDVPAGLCDSQITDAILRGLNHPGGNPPAVLLRGVNKSAFDVFACEIKRTIVNRRIGLGERYAGACFYATWIDGDAALPDRAALAELGPFIDSDSISWHRAKGAQSLYRFNSKQLDAGSKVEANTPLRELQDAAGNLPLLQSEVWRRTVRSAIEGFEQIAEVDIAQSRDCLLFHWIFPWLGTKRSIVDLAEFVSEHFAGMLDGADVPALVRRLSAQA